MWGGVLSSDDNMGGGCGRRTTTRGGVFVGRQHGGGDVDFFGENRKNRPEILVKLALSCYMYLIVISI